MFSIKSFHVLTLRLSGLRRLNITDFASSSGYELEAPASAHPSLGPRRQYNKLDKQCGRVLKYVSAQHFKHANGPYAFTNLEHRKRIQAIAKSVHLHSLSDNFKTIILQQQAASTSVNALKQAVQALFTQAKPNNANQCKQSMARTEQDQNSICSLSTWALGTGPTSISNGSGHVPGSKKTKETVVSLFGEKNVCKEIANFRIRLCLPGNEQCKQVLLQEVPICQKLHYNILSENFLLSSGYSILKAGRNCWIIDAESTLQAVAFQAKAPICFFFGTDPSISNRVSPVPLSTSRGIDRGGAPQTGRSNQIIELAPQPKNLNPNDHALFPTSDFQNLRVQENRFSKFASNTVTDLSPYEGKAYEADLSFRGAKCSEPRVAVSPPPDAYLQPNSPFLIMVHQPLPGPLSRCYDTTGPTAHPFRCTEPSARLPPPGSNFIRPLQEFGQILATKTSMASKMENHPIYSVANCASSKEAPGNKANNNQCKASAPNDTAKIGNNVNHALNLNSKGKHEVNENTSNQQLQQQKGEQVSEQYGTQKANEHLAFQNSITKLAFAKRKNEVVTNKEAKASNLFFSTVLLAALLGF